VTEVLRVDRHRPQPELMARAAACLRAGGLVAFPTETVYGLGVDALNRAAVQRLFAAKQRPANDPLIVHVARMDDVAALVDAVPPPARALAARFWPGPLTMVMRRAPGVPDEVTAGLETVGVRMPAHPVAHALIAAAGVPIAAPSANLFSRPSPTRAEHVLHDLDGRIDLIVDGGPTDVGLESTVIDLTAGSPVVLRPGAVTLEMLREVLPDVCSREPRAVSDDEAPASPGLLSKHYAPRAPLMLFRGAVAQQVAAAMDEAEQRLRREGRTVGRLTDVSAAGLYAALRDLDRSGADVILAADVPDTGGLSRAIRDRLARAAAQVIDVG
jgi:L-threonylcarbamoyladenylate synthase